MGHYILWADAERKADTFATRMVRGLGGGAVQRAQIAAFGLDRIGRSAVAARRDGRGRNVKSVRRKKRASKTAS
jgi:hypothetical protein